MARSHIPLACTQVTKSLHNNTLYPFLPSPCPLNATMRKSNAEEGRAFIISLGVFLRTMTKTNDRIQLTIKSVSRYGQ